VKVSDKQLSELIEVIRQALLPDGMSVAGDFQNAVVLTFPYKGNADDVTVKGNMDEFVSGVWESREDCIADAVDEWLDEFEQEQAGNFTYHPQGDAGKGYGITEEDLSLLEPGDALSAVEADARTELHADHADSEVAQAYMEALSRGFGHGWDAAVSGILDHAQHHPDPMLS
jgi:hypothetical protein